MGVDYLSVLAHSSYRAMAVSPMIAPSHSNTAPQKSADSGAATQLSQDVVDREITEQMNEEVRHKYIKGILLRPLFCIWLTLSKLKN